MNPATRFTPKISVGSGENSIPLPSVPIKRQLPIPQDDLLKLIGDEVLRQGKHLEWIKQETEFKSLTPEEKEERLKSAEDYARAKGIETPPRNQTKTRPVTPIPKPATASPAKPAQPNISSDCGCLCEICCTEEFPSKHCADCNAQNYYRRREERERNCETQGHQWTERVYNNYCKNCKAKAPPDRNAPEELNSPKPVPFKFGPNDAERRTYRLDTATANQLNSSVYPPATLSTACICQSCGSSRGGPICIECRRR